MARGAVIRLRQPSTFLRLHRTVEGLGGWRGGFVIFDEAGGGRGVRGEVGPSAGHAGGALQAVGYLGRAGVADEQTAAAVSLDGEGNWNDRRRIFVRNVIAIVTETSFSKSSDKY